MMTIPHQKWNVCCCYWAIDCGLGTSSSVSVLCSQVQGMDKCVVPFFDGEGNCVNVTQIEACEPTNNGRSMGDIITR